MPRTILGQIEEYKEMSSNSPDDYSIRESTGSKEELLLTATKKSRNGTSRSSGLTHDFRTKVLASLLDEGDEDEKSVAHTRTEAMFTDDLMHIKKMVGMMLKKEERFRKRTKLNSAHPKLYSPSYRGRISVWLREFCKDHSLSMTVFFRASQFLDLFLQHEHFWKKYMSKKLTDDDLYCMSLVALMIASKFGSVTIAVSQISRLTGRPNKTFSLMELDMLSLATDPGIEDSSYLYNSVTYDNFTWPLIRKGLENKLGHNLSSKDAALRKTFFKRKINFALHRALLDVKVAASFRSSLIAVAVIDAVMVDSGLKIDQSLWDLFNYNRELPEIKVAKSKILEALQHKDFCDIFTVYKKRWAAEDMKIRAEGEEDNEASKNQKVGYQQETKNEEENKSNAN